MTRHWGSCYNYFLGKQQVARTVAPVILYLVQTFILSAQCTGDRYLQEVFSAARSTSNQTYASAPALAGLCNLEWLTLNDNLQLDVYTPVGDTATRRPCIVYAHGGAFVLGDKRMAPVEDFCYAMARRGYVVVSIDYRKCFNLLSFDSPVRAVYRAVQDMSSAIRYVKEFAPLYGVDTNLVIAAGNSAGGFMAVHVAYAEEDERAAALGSTYNFPDLGCVDCSGNSYDHSSKPNAVLNFWGAILDTAWIEPGDAPILSIHGGADVIVYPGYWPPFSWPLFPAVYGSLPINERADHLGIPSDLWYLPLEGHEPWLLSVNAGYYFDFAVEKASAFLMDHLLRPYTSSPSGSAASCVGQTESYSVTAQPGERYCWSVSGGNLLSAVGNSAEVLWTAAGSGTVTVRALSAAGASGEPATLSVAIGDNCCPQPAGLLEVVSGPQTAALSWTAVDAALGYELEGGLSGGVLKSIAQSGVSRTLDFLKPGRSYRWRVRSICETGSSEFTPFRFFSTPLSREAVSTLSLLYPNPGNGLFTLRLPVEWNGQEVTIQVFDLMGRAQFERPAFTLSGDVPVDLRHLELPAGPYLLQWEVEGVREMLLLSIAR